jgi:apolipoprotein N-acyltransferase
MSGGDGRPRPSPGRPGGWPATAVGATTSRAAVGGGLLGLSTPAWAWPVGALVGVALATSGVGRSTREDAVLGALFGATSAGAALRFVPAAFTAATGSPGWPAWLVLSAIGAGTWAVGFAAAGAMLRRSVDPSVAFGLAFAVSEGLSGLGSVPTGVTAALAACPALLGPAALGGRPLLALALGAALGRVRPAVTLPVFGAITLLSWSLEPPTPTIPVAAVQLDRPSDVGVSHDADRAAQIDALLRQVGDVALVVTPEGAWPWPLGRTERGRSDFRAMFADLPPVLLAGVEADGDVATNAAVAVVAGEVVGRYEKRRLVPGVEASWFGWGDDRFAPGATPDVVRIGDLDVAVRICWEDLRPGSVDADLLAIPTSDVWLGPTGAAAHLDAARLAAVTTGRWVVRAARNGPSAVIDPMGRVHGRLAWTNPSVDASGSVVVGRVGAPRGSGASLGPVGVAAAVAGLAAALGATRRVGAEARQTRP